MPNDLKVINALMDAWKVQDVQQTLAFLSDDIVFVVNHDEVASTDMGVTRGKAAVAALMTHMTTDFEYAEYDQSLLSLIDGVARIRTRYRIVHRTTGYDLAASKLMIVHLLDGLAAKVEQIEDAAMVAAFMKLARGYVTQAGRAEWNAYAEAGTTTDGRACDTPRPLPADEPQPR
ncbi:MAG: nuclear transport factor 2 family protein [Hyphomicrobiaceae bacterium]|nr:nuclear transport factor 2 family protein [Hyphomicrobiaceae bacterium]